MVWHFVPYISYRAVFFGYSVRKQMPSPTEAARPAGRAFNTWAYLSLVAPCSLGKFCRSKIWWDKEFAKLIINPGILGRVFAPKSNLKPPGGHCCICFPRRPSGKVTINGGFEWDNHGKSSINGGFPWGFLQADDRRVPHKLQPSFQHRQA